MSRGGEQAELRVEGGGLRERMEGQMASALPCSTVRPYVSVRAGDRPGIMVDANSIRYPPDAALD
jgi:hypothetical protein